MSESTHPILNLTKKRYFPVFKDQIPNKLQDQFKNIATMSNKMFLYLFSDYSNKLYMDNLSIPLELVWKNMNKLALPVYREYVETTDNRAFIYICNDFFRYLFWSGDIYVYYEEDKFSAYYKLKKPISKEKDDHDFEFVDIQTGDTYVIKEYKELLIKLSWDTDNPEDNFVNWFLACYKFIKDDQMIDNIKSLSMKQLIAKTYTTKSNTKESVKELRERLSSVDSFILENNLDRDDVEESIGVVPANFLLPSEFRNFVLGIYNERDRILYELGRVANLNPKGERLTTGENYKDIVGISNRQRGMLNTLKAFAFQCEDRWDIKLSFAINGIPERQGMPTDSETASLPTVGD